MKRQVATSVQNVEKNIKLIIKKPSTVPIKRNCTKMVPEKTGLKALTYLKKGIVLQYLDSFQNTNFKSKSQI